MGHSERTDAELLAAHVAGDRYAFAELYTRHHRRLRRLARLSTGCPQDAEDALQEAMLAAHRSAAGFRHNAAVSSWLHRIVVNACLDRTRRKRFACTELLSTHAIVGDRTAEVDTALEVRAALRRLPVNQRAAVIAVDMHGYSVADAARTFGVPPGTIKSRCARGRARLAVLLRQTHPPGAAARRPGGPIPLAPEGAAPGRVDDCA
ncbi:RNA polymerase sigma factor SigM [Mycolicibacter minnesotensis]